MGARQQLRAANTAILALTRQFGWRKTTWMLDFTAAWAIAARNNGWQPIDVEQFAGYWRMSRAQGFREQAKWREMFPDQPTPNDLVLKARADYERATAEMDREPSRNELAAVFATLAAA